MGLVASGCLITGDVLSGKVVEDSPGDPSSDTSDATTGGDCLGPGEGEGGTTWPAPLFDEALEWCSHRCDHELECGLIEPPAHQQCLDFCVQDATFLLEQGGDCCLAAFLDLNRCSVELSCLGLAAFIEEGDADSCEFERAQLELACGLWRW
jgi:hypothetical protein